VGEGGFFLAWRSAICGEHQKSRNTTNREYELEMRVARHGMLFHYAWLVDAAAGSKYKAPPTWP
jgi:hypothetical protein